MADLNVHGVNRNAVRAGDSVTYAPVVVGDPDLTARVEYVTSEFAHVTTPGGDQRAIAWRRVTGHQAGRRG